MTISYVAASTPQAPGGPGNSPGAKAGLSLSRVQHGREVDATVRIVSNRSTLNAKLLWKKSSRKKPLLLGSLTEAPLEKGLHSFIVRLNSRGVRKLAALGRLKLTLAVKVTPPRGAVVKATKPVTLKP